MKSNLRQEDSALLAVFGVEDLPWQIVPPHPPASPHTSFILSFPGARINAAISDCGRFGVGIHRDPNSTFCGPRLSGSKDGQDWLNEARRSLGLPERWVSQ